MKRLVIGRDQVVGPWVCERTGGEYSGGTTIGMESDGELVAGVLFDNWNGRSMAMHVAAVDGSSWLTREYLRVCFTYAFEKMKVVKLLGFVDMANDRARRFDEHLGFALEARIADAAPKGDLLIYSMTAAQCRYLEA